MSNSYKRKEITSKHWEMIKDFCNGERYRDLEDKYDVGSRTIGQLAKQVGITPRPTGFASYKIARQWVLKAQNEYAKAYFQSKLAQSIAPVNEDNKHYT